MNDNDKNRNVGIGFLGALTILFIGLKLCGVIKWSWLWVLSPMWGPIALFLVVIAVCVVISVIKTITSERRMKK